MDERRIASSNPRWPHLCRPALSSKDRRPFARIEKWQDRQTGKAYWKSISEDNITSVYGKTSGARIADPDDDTKIFKWLLEESHDDKGNSIVYEYNRKKRRASLSRSQNIGENSKRVPAMVTCTIRNQNSTAGRQVGKVNFRPFVVNGMSLEPQKPEKRCRFETRYINGQPADSVSLKLPMRFLRRTRVAFPKMVPIFCRNLTVLFQNFRRQTTELGL